MVVRIESVDNGYVVSSDDTKVVIEQAQNSDKDCQAIRTMLYEVLEQLGETGSKHDVERVRVIVVNQDGEEVEEK